MVDHTSGEGIAVEIVPKESNPERARAINERRVLEVEQLSRRFRGFLDRELFWYWETFRYPKGGSRVISLANLKAEGEIVLGTARRPSLLRNPSICSRIRGGELNLKYLI